MRKLLLVELRDDGEGYEARGERYEASLFAANGPAVLEGASSDLSQETLAQLCDILLDTRTCGAEVEPHRASDPKYAQVLTQLLPEAQHELDQAEAR